jgi:glycosyltransferase involved in cell wall biosynthesis
MRIGIDVRYLSHGLVGGVHAYIKSFVPELIRQAETHQIVLYADTKRPFELSSLPPNVSVQLLPYRNPFSSFYIDLTMRQAMERDRIDVAHFPANYGFGPRNGSTIITLHDEINIMPLREIISGHRKNLRTLTMMTYLHLCSTAAVRQADLLITVSAYAARQIAHYGTIRSDRIVPIHHGRALDLCRITDQVRIDQVRQQYELNKPFILGDALKNPAATIRAWRRLPAHLRDTHMVVFFSRRPDPLPVVNEAVADGSARLIIRPSRDELITLLSMAQAFVFPSWIEGFGIPLLEAMTCGAPVIASDRGSIPEVLSNAGLIADAEDDQAIAAHLTTILSNQATSDDLRQRGFRRAEEFSWTKTAAAILASYEQVFSATQLSHAI